MKVEDAGPNIPLIRKVMEAIEANPQHWDQGAWGLRMSVTGLFKKFWGKNRKKAEQMTQDAELCGTTMCFAGWACYLNGDKFVWDATSSSIAPEAVQKITYQDEKGRTKSKYPADRAQEILGLDDSQRQEIFFSFPRTPAAMRKIVERAVGERL